MAMLGDILRREREKQGLTLKDVEEETSIRTLYIDAIENGQYDVLPGEVYVRGFIKNYAAFLKLDANELLEAYRQENCTTEPAMPQEDLAANPPVAPKEKYVSESFINDYSKSDNDFKDRVARSRSTQKYFVLMAVMVVFLGGAYYFFTGDNDTTDDKSKPAVSMGQKQPTAEPKTEQKAATADTQQEVIVKAQFTDRCWTKVEADGKTVFEGTVDKGKTFSWNGKNKIIMTAGNAGAVAVTVNGKSQGKLGAVGEVVEKEFSTADAGHGE